MLKRILLKSATRVLRNICIIIIKKWTENFEKSYSEPFEDVCGINVQHRTHSSARVINTIATVSALTVGCNIAACLLSHPPVRQESLATCPLIVRVGTTQAANRRSLETLGPIAEVKRSVL